MVLKNLFNLQGHRNVVHVMAQELNLVLMRLCVQFVMGQESKLNNMDMLLYKVFVLVVMDKGLHLVRVCLVMEQGLFINKLKNLLLYLKESIME